MWFCRPILCKPLLLYTASTWGVNVFCEGGCSMSAANKAVIRRYFEEVVNKGNLAAADELFSTHYVSHYPTGYVFGGGPEDGKQITTVVRIAFSDVHFTLDVVLADGEKVLARWTFRGTRVDHFMGI